MVSRRQLLQGVISDRQQMYYPPWSVASERFIDCCNRCEDCIKACPEHILTKNEQGYPVVDFSRSGCSFCAKCAEACNTGSLSLMEFIGAEPWPLKAVVSEFCVNYKGTVCQMCADSCELKAIKFRVYQGGITLPEIDLHSCNGCGACYRSCPKQAIEIKPG